MALVIAGYYGFGNAGDELILSSLIIRFRKNAPGLSITVLSQNPEQTARLFQVNAVDRWRPWTWVWPLLRADRFVLGGGGLLQDTTGPWNYAYYLSLVFLAKLFRCRTEALSMGVDPILRPANRRITRWVMNHALDFISVRDEESRRVLQDVGVTRPVKIEPDPVFDLPIMKSAAPPNAVALALSPRKGRLLWAEEASEFCDLISERLQVSVDLLVFFPEEDEALARDVARFSRRVRRVLICENPSDLLSWVPQYQLLVSTRFHALVLAAMAGIPFMGWGNQKKVAALCKKRGQPWSNIDEEWNVLREMGRLLPLYQMRNKSVILEKRIG